MSSVMNRFEDCGALIQAAVVSIKNRQIVALFPATIS